MCLAASHPVAMATPNKAEAATPNPGEWKESGFNLEENLGTELAPLLILEWVSVFKSKSNTFPYCLKLV